MGSVFRGKVNVDIRDSVPDWEPFLQPKAPPGSPNELMIVWDDAGYGCVGRDSASAVSPDYAPPYQLVGATIDRVVIDVSGEHFVDHEKEVLAYLARD